MNYSDPDQVPAVWQVDDIILDKYVVREVFEGGGMGLVYRVYHLDWDMELAVKCPRQELFHTEEQIANFEHEAETWVNLGIHPHIVSCYYVRKLGGIPRIFSEFIEGGTLSEWIRDGRLYEGGNNTALMRVLDIAIQVAWGLHYAHEKRLVHQDVKPSNVLMMTDGTAKVSDFGLANARSLTDASDHVAHRPGKSIFVEGSGFLTPEYASPEQFRGESLSRRSDIWSWAVMVLEMMKGECDWSDGRAATEVLAAFYGDKINSDPLSQLLKRCLNWDESERPTSFITITDGLQDLLATTSGQKYQRVMPSDSSIEMVSLNNQAIALVELGKILNTSGVSGKNAVLAFETLLDRYPLNNTVRLNIALFHWLHLSRPIDQLDADLDTIKQLPGRSLDVSLLTNIELSKNSTRRALSLSNKTANESNIPRLRHQDLKEQLQAFFESPPIIDYKKQVNDTPSLHIPNNDDATICYGGLHSEYQCIVRIEERTNITISVLPDNQVVFQTNFQNALHTYVALNELGTLLAIVKISAANLTILNAEQSHAICVQIVKLSDNSIIFETQHEHNYYAELQSITQAGIRVTLDATGARVDLWILGGAQFARPGVRRIEIVRINGEIKWFYDFRHVEPIGFHTTIFKISYDGSRLLTATRSNAQLWQLNQMRFKKCIMDINFHDFSILRRDGLLPHFELDQGFEYTVNDQHGYPLLNAMHELESKTDGLLSIIKPIDFLTLSRAQQSYESLLHEINNAIKANNLELAISCLDTAMESSLADMTTLLEKRWALAENSAQKFAVKGWHVHTYNEYYASSILHILSSSNHFFTIIRDDLDFEVRSVRMMESNHRWERHTVFDGVAKSGVTSLGPAGKYGHLILRRLESTSSQHSSLELHQFDRIFSGSISSSIWSAIVYCDVYNEKKRGGHFVATDTTVIAPTSPNEITIFNASDGAIIKRIAFDSVVDSIVPLQNSNGLCETALVCTKEPCRIYRINEEGKIHDWNQTSVRASLFMVQAISTSGSVAIFSKNRDVSVVIYESLITQIDVVLWDPFEGFPEWAQGGPIKRLAIESRWWNSNSCYLWTLSHCGRLVACIYDNWLVVLDVPARRRVMIWKIFGLGAQSICFDLSGRWLALSHSNNIREEFEIMWNPISYK